MSAYNSKSPKPIFPVKNDKETIWEKIGTLGRRKVIKEGILMYTNSKALIIMPLINRASYNTKNFKRNKGVISTLQNNLVTLFYLYSKCHNINLLNIQMRYRGSKLKNAIFRRFLSGLWSEA